MKQPILRAALLVLTLSLAATRSGAVTLAGSDDFDDNLVDPALWGADSEAGTFSGDQPAPRVHRLPGC